MPAILELNTSKETFEAVRSQWQNPEDILSVLMIIGGDIVQRAISQLAGVSLFTPVAFSFGWVAYAFSAIMSAFGNHHLIPPPDCDCILLNVQSGQFRSNRSWVLGRLVRDYEPAQASALTVTFFRVRHDKPFGVADYDWVFWMSSAVILLQFGIACIPAGLYGNWVVLILVASGTLIAQLASTLPQWRAEKWNARPSDNKRTVVCLTRGNGSNTVLVIVSEPNVGLRFEDLAGGREASGQVLTGPATVIIAALWIVHLITTQSSSNGWFSLSVGALGMVQNVIAAGVRRDPKALGIHLEQTGSVKASKVFKALRAADAIEPHVGLALVDVFFPGGLRADEQKWRDGREQELRTEDSLRRQELATGLEKTGGLPA